MVNLQNIKIARQKEKITLKKMADVLGYATASGYFRVESGDVKLLAEQVPIICETLHLQYSDIFFGSGLSETENKEDI